MLIYNFFYYLILIVNHYLLILVPSDLPKNLRVSSVTATRAELMWNEIECELRHGKIISYNYELEALSARNSNISLETQTHRVSLDSLAPFTEYRARVRGQNSQGSGPFTKWVTFQTLPAGYFSFVYLNIFKLHFVILLNAVNKFFYFKKKFIKKENLYIL